MNSRNRFTGRKAFWSLLAAVPLLAAGVAAQDVPSSLDDQIEIALRSNPEVLMARAHVDQAAAEYKAARLRVSEEVLSNHYERMNLEQMLQQTHLRLQEVQSLVDKGMASPAELRELETQLITTQNQIEQNRFRLRGMLGLGEGEVPSRNQPSGGGGPVRRSVARPPVPDNLQPFLGTMVEVSFVAMPLPAAIRSLSEQVATRSQRPYSILLNANTLSEEFGDPEDLQVTLSMKATLKEVLLALADLLDVCFVVRDYGILVTSHYHAQVLYAAVIPPETPLDPAVSEDLEALRGLGYVGDPGTSGAR